MKEETGRNKDNTRGGTVRHMIARECISLLIYLAVIFLATFLVIHYVGQRTRVNGSSMEPTLQDGDNLIVDKLTYRFHDPQRFDIIVFPYQYAEKTYYIKRIIGLPGEKVYIDEDGIIYINDEELIESYGKEVIEDSGLAGETVTLGADEYFVLGDNRNNSSDSRVADVANIKREDIIGRAWLRIYPLDKFGLIKHQ